MQNEFVKKYDDYLFDGGNQLYGNEQLWKVCEPVVLSLVDEFYHNIMSVDELRTVLGDSGRIAGLKSAQLNHWKNLLGGDLGVDYQKSAMKIGDIHHKIGLDQGWYLASYTWVMMRLLPRIASKYRFRQGRMTEQLQQIVARVFIDIMLSTSAYEEKSMGQVMDLQNDTSATMNLRRLADTVVQVNETSYRLARLTSNAKEARLGSQTISSAASELVASVEQIAVNSESASQEANDSNETAREGHEAINEATNAIQKMLEAVHETHEGIEELSEASAQIGQILSVIEDIAEQTNLLALNATIEAARAGEAGKGFAVVASEVKNLASQTSKSTEDIARRIDALSSGMDKIRRTMTHSQSAVSEGEEAVARARETMEVISGQVSGVSEKMLDISNILQQQKGATNEIAHSISHVADLSAQNEELIDGMADSFQETNDGFMENAGSWFSEGSDQALCEMAKIDHVLFKKNILDAVMGRTVLAKGQVPNHHDCRLGKWYDSLCTPALINHPAYQALMIPHKAVHEEGKRALESFSAGDFAGTIDHIERMNEASIDVVVLLSELSASLDEAQNIKNKRQYERLTTRMNAKLDGGSFAGKNIVVEDISKGGIGIRGARLKAGEKVTVSVGNDGPRQGVAKWTSGDRAGIKFEEAAQNPAVRKAG